MMVARRLPNGNLLIPIRAEGEGGLVGHGMIEIGPDHPDYEKWAADADRFARETARDHKRGLIQDAIFGVEDQMASESGPMLSVAFKEWAVICAALAAARQSLILRKGGIAEEGGVFRPEHAEFLLYPTYFHEHRNGIKPRFLSLLEAVEAARPPAGVVRFTHFVRVESVARVTDLESALALDFLHAWTPEVVAQRFHYRTPGLFLLNVRAFRLTQPVDVVERPEYAGCKTWVALDAPIDATGATPELPGPREHS